VELLVNDRSSRPLPRFPALLDWRDELAIYLVLNGVAPMTRRIDILKIIGFAIAIAVLFYFLARPGT
jgi:hypothetical protein